MTVIIFAGFGHVRSEVGRSDTPTSCDDDSVVGQFTLYSKRVGLPVRLTFYVFRNQSRGGFLPVVQRPFGDGGLEPIEGRAGGFVEGVIIRAVGVGFEADHVREIQRVVVSPLVGGAEFGAGLGL